MRSARSNAAWALLTSLLLTLGCAPRVEDCRHLLPVMDGPVTVVQTPLVTTGCSCTTDDVVIVVEARRHYLSFERGQVWIDGIPVLLEEFTTKLEEAKARHRAERMARELEARTRPVRHAIHNLGKHLHDLFKSHP